jgi:hypothetical protein
MRSPSKRRDASPIPNTGIVRVVDLPDLIRTPPKRRMRVAPPVEHGAALRPIKRRWQPLAALASRWQLIGTVAALTCMWLFGGLAVAWGWNYLSSSADASVVAEKPAEPPAEPPAAPVVAVETKPVSNPADELPGSVKAGPTSTVTVSTSPPAPSEAKVIADRNTELLEALLARTQQQPIAPPEPPKPKCVSCGTAVKLISDPELAAKQAALEHKLLFVIHLAGNLEESKFT